MPFEEGWSHLTLTLLPLDLALPKESPGSFASTLFELLRRLKRANRLVYLLFYPVSSIDNPATAQGIVWWLALLCCLPWLRPLLQLLLTKVNGKAPDPSSSTRQPQFSDSAPLLPTSSKIQGRASPFATQSGAARRGSASPFRAPLASRFGSTPTHDSF